MSGDRGAQATLSERYWLTETGWAAAERAQQAIAAGDLEPLQSAPKVTR